MANCSKIVLEPRFIVHSLQSTIPRTHRGFMLTASKTPGLVVIASCAGALLLGLFGCATGHHHTVEDYRQQYGRPLLSPGTQFAALPPAVQNTIRAEAGAADIEDVVKDTSSGHVIYQVRFQNSNWFEPL